MQRPILLAVLIVGLASCGGGGSHGTSGSAFVKNQVAATSETTDPVQINDLDLEFPDNTAVFDVLFQ